MGTEKSSSGWGSEAKAKSSSDPCWCYYNQSLLIIVNQQWQLPPSGSLLHRLVNPSMSRCIYYKHQVLTCCTGSASPSQRANLTRPQLFCVSVVVLYSFPCNSNRDSITKPRISNYIYSKKIKSEFPCLKIKIYLHI